MENKVWLSHVHFAAKTTQHSIIDSSIIDSSLTTRKIPQAFVIERTSTNKLLIGSIHKTKQRNGS